MSDIARQIKDLCIAREALSRFPGTESLSMELESITHKLRDKLAEELYPPVQYKPKIIEDDEIPF